MASTTTTKSQKNPREKTVELRLSVTKHYVEEFTFEKFVDMQEKPQGTMTAEEVYAAYEPLWIAFLKKHRKGIDLEGIEEDQDQDAEGLDILDCYGPACDEMEELVNEH